MNHIRAQRERRGWSQSQLAKRLGVTQAAVSLYEMHLRRPSPWVARRMAKVLGIPIEVLRPATRDLIPVVFLKVPPLSEAPRR